MTKKLIDIIIILLKHSKTLPMTASKTGTCSHNNWATPSDFYEELNKEFDFNFDPCPLNHDTNEWDGTKVDWKERNYVNPPYSRKEKEAFIRKAREEQLKGNLSVMLLPVSTSSKVFHEVILPNAEIRFIKGRLKFGGSSKCGTFDSMLCIFRPPHDTDSDTDIDSADDEPSLMDFYQ
jgi:site-specific DNA-methyltransferase (adenine-specific)